ncbi:hypothetical protein ACI65C_006361 [Semiaphis heraclei]
MLIAFITRLTANSGNSRGHQKSQRPKTWSVGRVVVNHSIQHCHPRLKSMKSALLGTLKVMIKFHLLSNTFKYAVRVITCDLTNEIHFRLKAEVEMVRMKKAYCKKLGHEVGEIRFVFDGLRITDSDTPKSLGLVDDDVIEVYQERTGGGM